MLDINNSRILDIDYPTHNVMVFLGHNNYALKLKEHLKNSEYKSKKILIHVVHQFLKTLNTRTAAKRSVTI